MPAAFDAGFSLPAGRHGRFGVVKLWPDVQVAEDEVIARLKRAAGKLGLECLEIYSDGRFVGNPEAIANRKTLDFVIHLHFETPKAYDAHSFVALWNPLRFYYDYQWGRYRAQVQHLATHDDYLSCGSQAADDVVRRQLRARGLPDPAPYPTMYHSLAEPILAPRSGPKKLFYAGINWERLGKGRSRHQELLEHFDATGQMVIYGPETLHGVKVWKGFKSYQGEIPFDGASMIERIAEAGVMLALSSEAHKESGIMSNRLFEGLAAGAVVIADENPFVDEHFGEEVLRIDGSLPTSEVIAQLEAHLAWIAAHPEDARALAEKAQAKFLGGYTMDRSLAALYARLPEQAAEAAQETITAFFLAPLGDEETAARHAASVRAQLHPRVEAVLLVDEAVPEAPAFPGRVERARFAAQLKDVKKGKGRARGRVLAPFLEALPENALFSIVEENERLFSDHFSTLAETLRRTGASAAASDRVTRRLNETSKHYDLWHETGSPKVIRPGTAGSGRFLLRKTPESAFLLRHVAPYLDRKAAASFAAWGGVAPSYRSTLVSEVFPLPEDGDRLRLEDEVILDALPVSAKTELAEAAAGGSGMSEPAYLSFSQLSRPNRVQLAKDLFLALPLPFALQRVARRFYRLFNRLSA